MISEWNGCKETKTIWDHEDQLDEFPELWSNVLLKIKIKPSFMQSLMALFGSLLMVPEVDEDDTGAPMISGYKIQEQIWRSYLLTWTFRLYTAPLTVLLTESFSSTWYFVSCITDYRHYTTECVWSSYLCAMSWCSWLSARIGGWKWRRKSLLHTFILRRMYINECLLPWEDTL